MTEEIERYREEVTFLHQQMFYRNPSDSLVNSYLSAHRYLPELRRIEPAQMRLIQKIISKQLSVMGIEPWLRTKGDRHPITSKLLLISYLSECDASHPEFNRKHHCNKNGLLAIIRQGINGVFCLIHGRLEMIRHGIN
jgi:hypothetical protein